MRFFLFIMFRRFLVFLFVFHVEGVADAVAYEHKGQHDNHNGETGQQREISGVEKDVGVVLFDHCSPRGHGGLHTNSQETQASFEEYGGGEIGGGNDYDGSQDIGQDVSENDTESAVTQSFGSFDILFFADAEHLSANHTGDIHPHGKSHSHKDLPKAFTQSEGDGDNQKHGGYGPHDVDKPHYQAVDPTSEIGGQRAEGDADEQGNGNGNEAYGEAHATAYHYLTQHVTAVAVGAENESALLDAVLTHILLQFGHGVCMWLVFKVVVGSFAVGTGDGFVGVDGKSDVGKGETEYLAVVGGGTGVGLDTQAVGIETVFVYGIGVVAERFAVQHLGNKRSTLALDIFLHTEQSGGGAGLEGGEFEVLLVAIGGAVGGNEIAEDGGDGEEYDDNEAGHGHFVAFETPPHLAVEGHAALGIGHGIAQLLPEQASKKLPLCHYLSWYQVVMLYVMKLVQKQRYEIF